MIKTCLLTLIKSNLLNRSKWTIKRQKAKQITLTSNQPNTDTKAQNKTLVNSEKKYCLFYNRFGRCSRGDSCTYIHDPKHVALCPRLLPKTNFSILILSILIHNFLPIRFLRGTCNVDKCPYSHNTSPEKVPICSYFVAGCCNRENCPYSHIYYGKDAKFCLDFAKGFCPLGSKVKFIAPLV